jgi:hypothetical protein
VRNTSIRIGYLGYDFPAIIHGHEVCFVEHAVGVLLDRNALSGTDQVCRDTRKLVQVESDLSLLNILCLIHNKLATREIEEFVVRIPIG